MATTIDVREANRILSTVGAEMFRAARTETRGTLDMMADAARRRVPDWPLSRAYRRTGWKPNRGRLRYDAPKIRRSIRVVYGRSAAEYALRLGTITMSDPAGTLLDLAAVARERRTQGFVNGLYAYGRPSRIMWPAATQYYPRLVRDLEVVAAEVGRRVSAELEGT